MFESIEGFRADPEGVIYIEYAGGRLRRASERECAIIKRLAPDLVEALSVPAESA